MVAAPQPQSQAAPHRYRRCRMALPCRLQQLTYCVTHFIEKDLKLASSVIIGLLKYWPITNSQKEVMFLSEIEDVLEATSIRLNSINVWWLCLSGLLIVSRVLTFRVKILGTFLGSFCAYTWWTFRM
uniref:Uncharacterized protein n=1 Tax=Oryza brachyantha TaxID=4533 RepID=J3L4V8_ORYBR